ncbi:MAG: (2Fe-2S) ferredoxin domain-containing protein [Clostridia bacterium]|nr:(2Fe-2S) ferredoxin domain-containing protein [Clostridia bacterium]
MKTIAEIMALRDKMQAEIITRDSSEVNDIRIVVGLATCGIAAGARPVFNTMIDEVTTRNLKNVKVTRSGCLGMCKLEPIVEVFVPGEEKVTYILVDADKAKRIMADHIVNGNIVTEYLISNE